MINDLEQTYASARETVGIAYFYFDYKTKADQSPSKVIAALIKQLCLPRKELHPSVEKLYNQYSAVAVANMDIQELEKLLAELCMDFSKVFIVIDALDECEKPQRSELIQLILRARTPKVRILATSRNEPDIWVIFQDEAAILNIKPHRDDIDAFVRAEVEKSIVEGRLSLGDPGLKEIIIKKLTGGAQGMYVAQKPTQSLYLTPAGSSGFTTKFETSVNKQRMPTSRKHSTAYQRVYHKHICKLWRKSSRRMNATKKSQNGPFYGLSPRLAHYWSRNLSRRLLSSPAQRT